MDNNTEREEIQKNYTLKSEAVEQLLTEETPEYTQEELNRYKAAKGFRIPDWVKVVFLKLWFYGAVCYFIYWGLAMYIPGLLEMMFVLCVAMGMVTDVLLNSVLRFLEKTPGENNRWMVFPQKGFKGFVLNILYGALLVFCVYNLYDGINRAAMILTGRENTIFLAVEPLMFGLFCMGFDMLFIAIKRLLLRILEDAKHSAANP